MTKRKQFTGSFEYGDTVEVTIGSLTVEARLERDEDYGPPWQECDGHGPVSDWTRRDKYPGERVLCEDHGSKRYYDVQEATKLARKDGWDTPPYRTGTRGETAARAVAADFKYLRRWCNDEWWYCVLILSVSKNGITLDDCAACCGGIESDSTDYLVDVANDLLPEALARGKEALASMKKKLSAK